MQSENIFETIEAEDGVYNGIVDYVSKRQVILYDISRSNEALCRLIVIQWKLYHFDMRFSIFKEIYYPKAKFPDPIVLNINAIKTATFDLEPTKPKRSRYRVTSE